jgi:hypothetical protein
MGISSRLALVSAASATGTGGPPPGAMPVGSGGVVGHGSLRLPVGPQAAGARGAQAARKVSVTGTVGARGDPPTTAGSFPARHGGVGDTGSLSWGRDSDSDLEDPQDGATTRIRMSTAALMARRLGGPGQGDDRPPTRSVAGLSATASCGGASGIPRAPPARTVMALGQGGPPCQRTDPRATGPSLSAGSLEAGGSSGRSARAAAMVSPRTAPSHDST